MDLQYLFAGFAVFWAGLFVYLLMLQARLASLHREIERLEERVAAADSAHAPVVIPGQRPPDDATDTPPAR